MKIKITPLKPQRRKRSVKGTISTVFLSDTLPDGALPIYGSMCDKCGAFIREEHGEHSDEECVVTEVLET